MLWACSSPRADFHNHVAYYIYIYILEIFVYRYTHYILLYMVIYYEL